MLKNRILLFLSRAHVRHHPVTGRVILLTHFRKILISLSLTGTGNTLKNLIIQIFKILLKLFSHNIFLSAAAALQSFVSLLSYTNRPPEIHTIF